MKLKKWIAQLLIFVLVIGLFPAGVSAETKTDFEAFALKIDRCGWETGKFRFVVDKTDIPFEVTQDNMLNLKVEGYAKKVGGDGSELPFSSKIETVDIRTSSVILVVPQSGEVIPGDDVSYNFTVTVYPEKSVSEIDTDLEGRPDREIAVKWNDTWLEPTADPVVLNGQMMIPVEPIYAAIGYQVLWNEERGTAIVSGGGFSAVLEAESKTAYINGKEMTLEADIVHQEAATFAPISFLEKSGFEYRIHEDGKTIFISAKKVPTVYYMNARGFQKLGTWTYKDDGYLMGLANPENEGGFDGSGTEPASVNVEITNPGTYKLWVRARDYSTNKPGVRFFHVAMDGVKYPDKMGTHGKDGFYWQEAGTYELEAGTHTIELLDTSGFYARCSGVLLTDDPEMVVPDDDTKLDSLNTALGLRNAVAQAYYPGWAKESFQAVKTDSIENEEVKIVFYQGTVSDKNLVQNEIYVKDKESGEWIPVKKRTEDFGFYMSRADMAAFVETHSDSGAEKGHNITSSITVGGNSIETTTRDFYLFGYGTWLIPADYEKVSDTKVRLTFRENDKVDFTAEYAFDELVTDPKVTIQADFKEDGAYSFAFFTGDGVLKEEFDTVTAPFLYIKHALPQEAVVLSESYLFTPMNTLYFTGENSAKVLGKELTSGVAADPSCVPQDFAYPETSRFGAMFYTDKGKVRSQLTAPMMGNDGSSFKAGDRYTFSVRVVNRLENWYDTYKHVAVDMYNCTDLRTNYYGSINDTIYNTTDLLLDDEVAGWIEDWKGYVNMEGKNWVSQYNIMSAAQSYMLTENEEMLERRVIPTIAYAISRGSGQYAPLADVTSPNVKAPTALKGFTPAFGAAVYGGLYEMSQGRMPFLLDYAVSGAYADDVKGAGAVYRYSGEESAKRRIIDAAEQYLKTYANSAENREIAHLEPFIFNDYSAMASTLTAAYELTGEARYLEKAEECGRLLMSAIWTTGYQNDYATTTYHIDPQDMLARPFHVDKMQYNFFWYQDIKWRLGNVKGEYKSPQELVAEGKAVLEAEDVPGWLPAKTGMGTEHEITPGHGNVVTMNTWLGTMVRLSVYTGDDWFETQARNAIVGRFTNYPGYYMDRYLSENCKPDYPYTGPDLTSIYYHHIPIFLTMVQDFLINEAWAKSGQQISFPYIYQEGVAYFNSYQFGQAPGTFYEEEDMWLWMDRDIVSTDNYNIDYVAARKDGVLGLAFLNEDNEQRTTTITLGSKVGSSVNTTATAYQADGTKFTVSVTDGKFTLTIPSKGMVSVVLKDLDTVTKPSYAKEYTYSSEVGQTVSAHVNGLGYVLQMTDDKYWAYVYISDMVDTIQRAALTYTVDGKTETVEDTQAGFEWLIRVDNPDADFTYSIEVTHLDGSKESYGGGTLKTIANSVLKGTGVTVGTSSAPKPIKRVVPPVENDMQFEAFALTVENQGCSDDYFRFVCTKSDFPFEVSKDQLAGLRVKGVVVDGEKEIPFEGYVHSNEVRTDTIVVVVEQTQEVTTAMYPDMSKGQIWKLMLYPQKEQTTGYQVSLKGDTQIAKGENATVQLEAAHSTEQTFAAAEVVLQYDSTKLAFSKTDSMLNGATADGTKEGILKLADYGEEKALGTIYTLAFTALETGKASVEIKSAAFSNQTDAAAKDLIEAGLITAGFDITITPQNYSVTLPDIFTGPATVTEGEDYTFYAADAEHYDYTYVAASVNGTAVEVTDNGNGSYTVKAVDGDLVITGSRQAKSYRITFATGSGVKLPAEAEITYGTEYRFTMPVEEHYAISITDMKIGDRDVSYEIRNGEVIIPGAQITGDILVTIDKVRTDAAVSVEGTGASDGKGYQPYAVPGEDYTLTVTQDDRYEYTVTATVNGKEVELLQSENTYTISGQDVKAGSIVFVITKTIKTESFSVQEYLKLDGTTVWLVKADAAREAEQGYSYRGQKMFWSEQYQAYVTLVFADTKEGMPVINASDVELTDKAATIIEAGFDVNMTGKADANDAQLVYNLYNNHYQTPEELDSNVSIALEKFLRTDVNGDGKVDVNDAAAVIHQILSAS